MAEVEYATTARLPVAAIWDFVRDMDNWATYLTGYQSHEKQDDDESVWVLKGDVGHLSRTLRFQVRVTEWAGPERVTFVLKGLNEPMEGGGEFRMEAWEDPEAASAAASRPPRAGFLQRALQAVVRLFFRLFRGRVDRAADADAGPGAGMARLCFRLELRPGGPMGPMVNAMIKPAMAVAAEDLANRIVGHLEQQRGDAP